MKAFAIEWQGYKSWKCKCVFAHMRKHVDKTTTLYRNKPHKYTHTETNQQQNNSKITKHTRQTRIENCSCHKQTNQSYICCVVFSNLPFGETMRKKAYNNNWEWKKIILMLTIFSWDKAHQFYDGISRSIFEFRAGRTIRNDQARNIFMRNRW